MSKLLAATAAAFSLLLTGCEREKTKLDREVDRLCAIDGGVKIYEKVKLSAENFGPDGEVFPQYRHLHPQGNGLGPEFYSKSTRKELVSGEPNLERVHIQILRRSDNKVLGEAVNYVRGGGDWPGPWNPSTHQCRQYLQSTVSLNHIFVRGE